MAASILLLLYLLHIRSCNGYTGGDTYVTRGAPLSFPYMLDSSVISNPLNQNSLKPTFSLSSTSGLLDVIIVVKSTTIVVDGLFSYTTRAFCYNEVCGPTGPTLYVSPGDQLM